MSRSKCKGNKLKDILVLYDGKDSSSWKDFILERFDACPSKKLQIEDKDLSDDVKDAAAAAKQFSMVLVVASDEMLNTLQSHCSTFEPSLRSHLCVAVIKLYVDENSYSTKLSKNYSSSKDWKTWSIGENNAEDEINQYMSEIIDTLQKVSVPSPPKPGRIHSVCPDNIKQGGETVVMVLRKAIDEGQCVQVTVGDEETKIDTETLNPYCFRFKAPAHRGGRADIRLFIDGKKISKIPIYYHSMVKFAYTCPEFLCQLIGLQPDDHDGLDKELTSIFKSSVPLDGTLQNLLTPRNLQATSQTSGESCGELPTLLHFACKYNLSELAASIVETPGARLAMEMDNERGLNPLALAQEAKNEDLVNYLESFMEMHDYVTDIEDIYERMSGGKSLESYVNESATRKGSGYLPMAGRDSVQEAYYDCRVPESDYEIGVAQSTLVQEVSPKEDIHSEPLPPVPERPSPGGHRPVPSRQSPKAPSRPDALDVSERSSFGYSALTMPQEDFFADQSPMSPHSLGSSNLDELSQYMESYKRGEFNMEDIERLYRAWTQRNKELSSCSLKERKKQLDELKSTYVTVLQAKKQATKTSRKFFSRKKQPEPQLEIKHNVSPVQPNKYESWNIMKGTHTLPKNFRESTISNASTTSSSSSSSRDSALGPVQEFESDEEEVPPAVPLRRTPSGSTTPEKRQHRTSWGEDFLKSVQNRPGSRLPPVPTRSGRVSRLPPTPEVPSRPTPVSKKPR